MLGSLAQNSPAQCRLMLSSLMLGSLVLGSRSGDG